MIQYIFHNPYSSMINIYSYELTYISATNVSCRKGNPQATKLRFVLFSVGVRNQNILNHPDNFRAD